MDSVTIYNKMGSDSVANRQPENTFTYALNQVIRNNSLVTEYGFSTVATLDDGFVEISSYYISNNKSVVFATNGIVSTIGVFDGVTYVEHVRADLKFDLNYFIDCTYRLKNGCEDIIYFTDGLNPIRFYNFSKPENFKTRGNWDANKFSLNRTFKKPEVSDIRILSSGAKIKAGAIIFAIDYLDNDLNPTPILNNTHPVIIYSGNSSNPVGTYDDLFVSKAVQLTIINLDTDFKFYRVYICYIDNKTSKVSSVKRTLPINIEQNIFEFNNLQPLDEVAIENLYYSGTIIDKALAIEQIDNTLIVANSKSETIDAAAHQKLASKIGTVASIKQVNASASHTKYHPNNPNYLEVASHMADEVVALSITYVNSLTGKESGPYHIPGRPRDVNPFTCKQLDSSPSYKLHYVSISFTVNIRNTSRIEIKYSVTSNGTAVDKIIVFNPITKQQATKTIDLVFQEDEAFKLIHVKEIDLAGSPDLVAQSNYSITYSTKTVYNIANDVFNGWDSSIITYITTDHAPFGIKSISDLLPYYYNFYNNGDTIPYDEVKFKRADFLDYLKEAIDNNELDFPYRWEIHNTARYVESGKIILGYHENKYSYYNLPINSECIDDYWGVDICGNPLTGKNVRHHRVPDRKLIPVNEESVLNLIGFEFFNIEYPDGYDRHYFSCGVKTEEDTTIIDTGLATRQISANGITLSGVRIPVNTKGSAYLYNHYATNPDLITGDIGFYSPKTLMNLHTPNGYIKTYYNYDNLGSSEEPQFNFRILFEFEEVSKFAGGDDLIIAIGKYSLNRSKILPKYTNYLPNAVFNLNVLGKDEYNEYTMRNVSSANRLIYFVKDRHEPNVNISYVSIKRNKDVYSNLDTIRYRKLHNNLFGLNDVNIVFGGDTYITKFNLVNYALASFEADNVGPMVTVFVAALNVAAAALTAGASIAVSATLGGVLLASGLSEAAYENALEETRTGTLGFISNHKLKTLIEDGFIGDGLVGYVMEVLEGVYIDSYINWELRINGKDDAVKILKNTSPRGLRNFVKSKFLVAPQTQDEKDNAGDNGLIMRPIIPPEFYLTNPDFSPQLSINDTYSIPSTYNHCSNCKEEFASRLHYSLQSFQEELTDNYRIFLPNNYKDVNGEFGPIVDIFKRNGKLMVSTAESLLEQPRNYQEKIIGDIVSYIGTGSYFELPTQEVISSASGRLGNINRCSTLNIPDGVVLIDLLHLKIWLIASGSIENLTGEKYQYKEWFERNLQLNLPKYIKGINTDSAGHCGYITTFDEVDKRILITKKDYIPKIEDISFDKNEFYTEKIKRIYLDDPEYFYNVSFTVSFSLISGGWVSFHSYVPTTYISMKNELYCSLNNKIYKFHDITKRANYFDVQYPCIVEFIVNNQITKTLYNNILISSHAEIFNPSTNSFKYLHNAGYDQILIYNERQCSGIINLYESNENNELGVTKILDNNIIHLFRDLVTNTDVPLFIENNTVDYRYSNKILNPQCIDTEKDWFNKYYFKSKTLVIRLILNNFDGVKIHTDLSVLNSLPHTKF